MIWDGSPFGGAKMAAILGDAMLVYARDDIAGIPFPGMLDLPGGGREGDESPAQCVVRELFEEFGVQLDVERLHYHRPYKLDDGVTNAHFFAAHLTEAEVEGVRFGDEGQDWALMSIADFTAHDQAVPRLRDWLGQYCAAAAEIRYLDTVSKNPGIA